MKKSLKKQAVFPVLMLLVVTALALIGSSFAWFSMANTASVATITGQVENSSVGLMISADASTFKSSINFANDSAATFVKPARFHQVSTVNGINFFEATIVQKNADGTAAQVYSTADFSVQYADGLAKGIVDKTVAENQRTYANSGVTSQASYMVLDLFFSVENASTLYLDYGTSFTTDQNSNATNKAMRIAFIYEGGIATGGTAAAAIALEADNPSAIIWDPSNDASYYGVNQASTSEHPFTPYVSSDYSASVTTKTTSQMVPAAQYTDESTPSTQAIATLIAGVNKVRVVVWLEGNDVSCTTAVANLNINFNMNFFAKKN